MNKNRHRIIFNAARGQRMVVAESAGCHAGSASGATSSSPVSASFTGAASNAFCVLAFAVLTQCAPAHAQIVADPTAPGNQRPIILQTANGTPLVQIRTPSAAGVSRNSYSAFDIQRNGVVLNNVRSNAAQTQIGGFVQANPFLATGAAKVILNEVNSSNPTYLKGPVEVAGQRAEVIIANPSGIRVSGGTFLNASGVTLTTGTPVMNSGNLESFRVTQGSVVVEGLGLDTRTADYTRILARAAEVNAGLWASHLKVVTGANDISADASTVTATRASAQGPAPRFMLDVAAIGGMYAGHIFLVGTEAGLGVNNGGVMSADAGNLVIDSDGWLRNKGTVQASGNVAITTQGEVKNDKDVYAGGALDIKTKEALTNSGNINAQGGLQIQGTATENLAGARIASNATLQVNTTGTQTNQGEMVAVGDLDLRASKLHNEGHLQSSAGQLNITSQGDVDNSGPNAQMYAADTQHINAAGAITNGGLIAAHGNLTVEANSVHSTGALAAGLNTDGSLKADAALLDVQATQQLTAQGNNLASGHLKLQGHSMSLARKLLQRSVKSAEGRS